MTNPYAGAQVLLKNGAPVTDLRFSGSNSRALDERTGEINAYNTKDLAIAISKMLDEANKGNLVRSNVSVSAEETQAKRELVLAAMNDAEAFRALAADIAVRVAEQRNREGFMRKVLLPQNVRTGELPRVIVEMWDAVSVVATGPTQVGYQVIRNKQFFPAEFELIGNLRAEAIELEQIGGDLLDKIYNQGVDSMMVAEDRLLKSAMDKAVGMVNPINYISGQLTPGTLASLRQGVTDWNLPCTTAIVDNSYWADIIGSNDFMSFLDPVNKYDLVLNGMLASLGGMTLLTDGFRQPNQKVLDRGDFYVFTTPEHLGCFSDRGGIRSQPSSGVDSGSTSRGWLLSEIISLVLANPRGVVKGKKI